MIDMYVSLFCAGYDKTRAIFQTRCLMLAYYHLSTRTTYTLLSSIYIVGMDAECTVHGNCENFRMHGIIILLSALLCMKLKLKR